MKKKVIIGVLALSIIAAGTGTGVYAYNQKVLAAETKQEQFRVETLKKAEDAVDSLYNGTRTNLADDIEEKIEKAKFAVAKVEENKEKTKLSNEISEVEKIAEIQQEVYKTLENGILNENVNNEQIEDITKKLSIIKSQNEPIYTQLSEYLSEAKAQLTVIDAALQKVVETEKSLNRKVYDSALILVDQVKNEAKKNEFKKQLGAVNEKIGAMEEEAKRKKEEEAEKLSVEKAIVSQIKTKQPKTVTSSVSKSVQSSSNGNSNKSTNTNPTSNSGSSSNKSSSSKSSNSETSSSKSPSKGSNSSKSSNSSSDGNIATDVQKTGEGAIKDHTSEDQTGANTYEEWSFEVPQDYYNK